MAKEAFALACKLCGWRPPVDQPMGVVAAHFEAEHQTRTVDLELVVVCDRCDRVMTHLATIGEEHHYQCEPCHRGRVVTQRQAQQAVDDA